MNLLEKYHKGIARVSPELANQIRDRSGGICEICGQRRATEIHHLVGRRRKAHPENLLHLCYSCHRGSEGIHRNFELQKKYMRIYQDWCISQGYTIEQVRYLLGTKSGKLF